MPNTFTRISSSARSAYGAFWASYNQEDFVAEEDFFWDDYEARMARYWHNRRYADNTIYTAINLALTQFKWKEKLYQHIQGLRNPVARLVRVEKSKIWGGLIDYETFNDGAIGIKDADENLLGAIRNIWQWSNMNVLKGLIVSEGATMGDVFLKQVDDVPRKKVRIEVLDPRKVKKVIFDSIGNIKAIEICYIRMNEDTGKEYEFTELIDKDHFELFEGETRIDEYKNPYGFVPVRGIKHADVGRNFGATSFHETRSKIDGLNDLVTLLHTNIRQQAVPKFALEGAASLPKQDSNPTTISVTADERDKAPILPIGNSKLVPIVYNADIANGLVLALQQQAEIEADLPQLALTRMRSEMGNASGVAIENLYSDSVDILEDTQVNYLSGLHDATQMAISMAAYRGYEGFQAYSLESYEAGTIDFELKPKPIFRSQISKEKRIELTLQAADSSASSLVLPLLDYDDEDIQEFENKKADESASAIRGMYEAAFGNADKEAQASQRLQDGGNSATIEASNEYS